MVTGGWNWNSNDRTGGRVSSTEVMEATATSWSFAGNLPSARRDLVGISFNNQIFMTGIFLLNLKPPDPSSMQKKSFPEKMSLDPTDRFSTKFVHA